MVGNASSIVPRVHEWDLNYSGPRAALVRAPRLLWHSPVQSRRLLAELLLQTSQLRPKDQVVVIAATNRMGELTCGRGRL